MSFTDCACHVFAINGYNSDADMTATNNAYINLIPPQQVVAGRGPDWKAKAQLEYIVAAIRAVTKPAMSRTVIKIYGGFRAGQLQPEHMWIEYNGWIYDTMPGSDLYAIQATGESRACPYLEGRTFAGNGSEAPFCETTATENQLQNFKNVTRQAT